VKKNTETLIYINREVSIEINVEKTKYMLINKYRNLRTQQMLVHSLVCIFPRHVLAPIDGHLQVVCNVKFRRQSLYIQW
jgi:hypothetical protein